MKVPSTFESYALTEDELRVATRFSELQRAMLHNLRTSYALQRLEILYDPQKPTKFMQEEAELKGSIAVLTYLLDESAPIINTTL